MRRPRLFLILAPLTFFACAAAAQDWPAHALRLIVPFPAGGSADVQSRLIAEALAAALGEPVVVDNRPGAGGNIAAAEAAHAGPDGTTLFMGTTGTQATNASLYTHPGFDPVNDFAPLTLVTSNPQVIVAAPQYNDLSLEALASRLKGNSRASFGSSGLGSATHIAGELFNRTAGTDLVHVPYRGQGPALTDLVAGRIDVMFPLIADVFPFLQSGQLRALAVIGDRRATSLPDVPTTAEASYPELVMSPIWTALYTTTGTPKLVVDRLNRELIQIISKRAFVERLEAAGYEIRASTPQQLRAFAAAETARWGALVKSLKIRME